VRAAVSDAPWPAFAAVIKVCVDPEYAAVTRGAARLATARSIAE
jgi:hypothetical protein